MNTNGALKGVYAQCQIEKKIIIPFNAVGKNLMPTIETTISQMIGGKCIVEGYVKPDSIRVITFSSGKIKGPDIIFDVVFSCDVCFPVAGMNLNCVVKNVTKAGIRAVSADETHSPFILFIARDHFYSSEIFNAVKEGDKITSRVIAQRFELNDQYVSIIGELVVMKKR
jgi:hypothetical protein